uniref:Uncharacterized protein n=1 Tax=Phlebotomus papatasi TaxID=29031 RepID=A0A1B0GP04_PHLPP
MSLTLHRDLHSGKTKCPVCKRSFSRSYDMRSHLNKIHKITLNFDAKLAPCPSPREIPRLTILNGPGIVPKYISQTLFTLRTRCYTSSSWLLNVSMLETCLVKTYYRNDPVKYSLNPNDICIFHSMRQHMWYPPEVYA